MMEQELDDLDVYCIECNAKFKGDYIFCSLTCENKCNAHLIINDKKLGEIVYCYSVDKENETDVVKDFFQYKDGMTSCPFCEGIIGTMPYKNSHKRKYRKLK